MRTAVSYHVPAADLRSPSPPHSLTEQCLVPAALAYTMLKTDAGTDETCPSEDLKSCSKNNVMLDLKTEFC